MLTACTFLCAAEQVKIWREQMIFTVYNEFSKWEYRLIFTIHNEFSKLEYILYVFLLFPS